MAKPFSADFGTAEDWGTRVNHSWVKYKGDFAHVRDIRSGVHRDDEAEYQRLRNMRIENSADIVEQQRATDALRHTINATLHVYNKGPDSTPANVVCDVKDLDLSYFKAGFVNFISKGRSTASYVSRHPMRQYKHGMYSRNTTYSCVPDCFSAFSRDSLFQPHRILRTLTDDYPTVAEALDKLFELEGCNSMAFDRDFAVRVDDLGHTLLYNRLVRIGFLEENERFRLLRRFNYLSEILTEKGVNFVT